MKLVNKAKLNRGPTPMRHSRFLPNFLETSSVGIKRITHKINSQAEPIQNLRHVPRRTADLKKVEKIDQNYFSENVLFKLFVVHGAWILMSRWWNRPTKNEKSWINGVLIESIVCLGGNETVKLVSFLLDL